jgi:hypothetical protein
MSPLEQMAAMGLTGRSAASWALIVYSALGPGALATYLQVLPIQHVIYPLRILEINVNNP